jgi:hypothetical protein
MTESVQIRLRSLDGYANKQVYDLLKAILIDIDTLRQNFNAHQHAALNAAPSTNAPITTSNATAPAAAGLNLNVSA